MFTGIIQSVGRIASVQGSVLKVTAEAAFRGEGFAEGESIAVNGACLTLVRGDADELEFDVSPETFARTALGCLKSGFPVNLERAMQVSSRFGGHFVQGHVDATGELVSVKASGEFFVYRFQIPAAYDRYLIDKGSISIDGISLTVVSPLAGSFDVWVVPHTIERTNLSFLTPGTAVNLEFDVLAKHVEKLLQAGLTPSLAV